MPHHHGQSGTSAGVQQGQSSSGGEYQNVHQTGAVSQTPGRTHGVTSTGNGTKGTKGTISTGDGLKNVSLAGSILTKNPVGAAVNILSRLVKRKSKPPRGHPETIAKSRIKRTPVIGGGEGGDGENVNRTQTAATSAQAAQPVKPKIAPFKPYYMGFDFQKPIDTATHRPLPMKSGGLSGGKRFGPPPKKGPNPHGKCPFRPDGIRGVGAVEKGRGVKFIGTK